MEASSEGTVALPGVRPGAAFLWSPNLGSSASKESPCGEGAAGLLAHICRGSPRPPGPRGPFSLHPPRRSQRQQPPFLPGLLPYPPALLSEPSRAAFLGEMS